MASIALAFTAQAQNLPATTDLEVPAPLHVEEEKSPDARILAMGEAIIKQNEMLEKLNASIREMTSSQDAANVAIESKIVALATEVEKSKNAPATAPTAPSASTGLKAEEVEGPNSVKIEFVPFDPARHQLIANKKAGETTKHKVESDTVYAVGEKHKYLIKDQGICVLRPVLCPDGESMLRGGGVKPFVKGEETPIELLAEEFTTNMKGEKVKTYSPFWFVAAN